VISAGTGLNCCTEISSGDLFAKIFSRAKAQRRKENLRNAVALCAFAPLREKYSSDKNAARGVERSRREWAISTPTVNRPAVDAASSLVWR